VLYFRAPGGGGYGDPLDRDVDYLQHDIDIGLVSPESATRDYGAVLDVSGTMIDKRATEERRLKLKQEWRRERIFIDQKTQPFARRPFRIVEIDEEIL
jgi:hypothetical protein